MNDPINLEEFKCLQQAKILCSVSKRKYEESDHQKAFFEWLSVQYPEYRKICFSIPNGGSRTIQYGSHLKKQGLTSGVSDVFCAIPIGYHGLFIEFKANKNKLTNSQARFKESIEAAGYKCIVVYSIDEAIREFKNYIK